MCPDAFLFWKPENKITDIIKIIIKSLEEPSSDSTVAPDIAALYKNDKTKFEESVKLWIQKNGK